MSEQDRHQIPWLRELLEREAWLEAERRGCPVSIDDPAVQMRAADILLSGTGADFRARAQAACPGQQQQ